MTKQYALKGVLFDLDGVLVDTAAYHYQAWKRLADDRGIYFDKQINERLKGVSRMASLEILLERSSVEYTTREKEELCTSKNNHYTQMIQNLTPEDVLKGVLPFLQELKAQGIKSAVCSASKSAKYIIAKLGLSELLDVIVDGNDVTRPKPDPEVFEQGYTKLGLDHRDCVVFEDAFAGIEAAKTIGLKTIGIGEKSILSNADFLIKSMEEMRLQYLIEKLNFREVE